MDNYDIMLKKSNGKPSVFFADRSFYVYSHSLSPAYSAIENKDSQDDQMERFGEHSWKAL
jgi:hypothetical protein